MLIGKLFTIEFCYIDSQSNVHNDKFEMFPEQKPVMITASKTFLIVDYVLNVFKIDCEYVSEEYIICLDVDDSRKYKTREQKLIWEIKEKDNIVIFDYSHEPSLSKFIREIP